MFFVKTVLPIVGFIIQPPAFLFPFRLPFC